MACGRRSHVFDLLRYNAAAPRVSPPDLIPTATAAAAAFGLSEVLVTMTRGLPGVDELEGVVARCMASLDRFFLTRNPAPLAMRSTAVTSKMAALNFRRALYRLSSVVTPGSGAESLPEIHGCSSSSGAVSRSPFSVLSRAFRGTEAVGGRGESGGAGDGRNGTTNPRAGDGAKHSSGASGPATAETARRTRAPATAQTLLRHAP